MNRIARLIGLAACLLLFFLAAVLLSQRWLEKQTEQVRAESLRAREIQLEKILALDRAGPPPWNEDFIRSLGEALNAKLQVLPAETAPQKPVVSTSGNRWQFDHAVVDQTGQPISVLRVNFTTPPVVQLVTIYQRLTAALFIFALALLLAFAGIATLGSRRTPHDAQNQPHPDALPSARAEMSSLARLAEVSVQQGQELQRERYERLRAEEDLHFQQVLLNRSLEEKIRLGRDLHDGIIQALYATGLTLEAAKNLLDRNPEEARRQVEVSLATLNTAIRDVRTYVMGLSPARLQEESFAESIRSLTQTLDAGRSVEFDLKIDGEVSTQLTETQTADLIQVLREAISNALRHGGATAITIRLQESGGEVCLVVQDNGSGFDADRPPKRGRGLDNMQARASRLGAILRYAKNSDRGTRLVLTLPVATPSVS